MATRQRRGVAAVLGAIFMVLVFMAAIGAQLYLIGTQSSTSQASLQAQGRESQRNAQQLSFSKVSGGLSATNTGPSAEIVGLVLKFENGTTYDLGNGTSPSFSQVSVSSGAVVQIQPLVPTKVCAPGAATCVSKYNSIVGAQVPGRGVGLVTSMGSTFWYFPSASGSSSSGTYYRTAASAATTSTAFVGVSGLSFTGAANTFYQVQISVAYFQGSSSNPAAAFAISVPSGTTYLFCGGLAWSNPAQGTTDLAPGNLCSASPNSSLGPTSNAQTFCTNSLSMCEFAGTAFVSFGSTSGLFQLEFEGAANDQVTVAANSVITVGPGQ